MSPLLKPEPLKLVPQACINCQLFGINDVRLSRSGNAARLKPYDTQYCVIF